MNTVTVRGLTIGEGIPKICVPIVGKTEQEILEEARSFDALDLDLVEWRVDHFEGLADADACVEVARKLNEILGSRVPLLCTVRTSQEGGMSTLSVKDYAQVNRALIDSGVADMIDVELFLGDETMTELVSHAHNNDVIVVASSHDFEKTPERDEIVGRLMHMQELGADILKIAVMPTAKHDVIELLAATEEMASHHADRPIVTMSMGGMGALSRICGEVFGSAITFGCASNASAPGQIDVADLHTLLSLVHATL